jgi:hypothetical protein
MAMKNRQAKVYRTMQGKQIDLDLLIKRNELTPAVGNAKVNARGDELGPGGKIVKKREEVIKDFYNTNAVVDEPTRKTVMPPVNALSEAEQKELAEFDEEPVPVKKATRSTSKKEEWIEDEDGNFVRKT